MAKTFAPNWRSSTLFSLLLIFLFSACASFRNSKEMLNSSRTIQLKMVGGIEKPGIRTITVDEDGFVHVESRFPGNNSEELFTRLNKPNRQKMFLYADSLEALHLKEEYQIGEDSKTYTLYLYRDGSSILTTRFSSGVPRTVLRLIDQLEKISEDE